MDNEVDEITFDFEIEDTPSEKDGSNIEIENENTIENNKNKIDDEKETLIKSIIDKQRRIKEQESIIKRLKSQKEQLI